MLLTTKLNPITLLYFMAPASLVLLLPFVVAFESGSILSRPDLLSPFNLGILLLSGLIALTLSTSYSLLCVEFRAHATSDVSQFFIIGYTSPLTFNVCGNLKVALSILVSVLIFQNEVRFPALSTLRCCSLLFSTDQLSECLRLHRGHTGLFLVLSHSTEKLRGTCATRCQQRCHRFDPAGHRQASALLLCCSRGCALNVPRRPTESDSTALSDSPRGCFPAARTFLQRCARLRGCNNRSTIHFSVCAFECIPGRLLKLLMPWQQLHSSIAVGNSFVPGSTTATVPSPISGAAVGSAVASTAGAG